MLNRKAAIASLSRFASLCLLAAAGPAALADPIGLYIGAGVGEADVPVNQINFSENHTGYKLLVGLRPIPVVGAELEYVDFGHPGTTLEGGASADAEIRGSALYGILYLPLPPMFDLYAKVGFSRLQTTASAHDGNVELFRFDETNTRAAFGAGAQVKLQAFALRGEYERFSSESGDPSFWSLAFTWSF
jgi:hypothetical protein